MRFSWSNIFRIKLKIGTKLKLYLEQKNISPVVLLKSTLFGGSCEKKTIFNIQHSISITKYSISDIQRLLRKTWLWFNIWLDLWNTWFMVKFLKIPEWKPAPMCHLRLVHCERVGEPRAGACFQVDLQVHLQDVLLLHLQAVLLLHLQAGGGQLPSLLLPFWCF